MLTVAPAPAWSTSDPVLANESEMRGSLDPSIRTVPSLRKLKGPGPEYEVRLKTGTWNSTTPPTRLSSVAGPYSVPTQNASTVGSTTSVPVLISVPPTTLPWEAPVTVIDP